MNEEDEPGGLGSYEGVVLPDPNAKAGDSDDYYRMVVMGMLRELQQRPGDEAFLDEVQRMVEIWIDYTKETIHDIGFNEGWELHKEKHGEAPGKETFFNPGGKF